MNLKSFLMSFATLSAFGALNFFPRASAADWLKTTFLSQESFIIAVDYTLKQPAFDGCYKCTQYTKTDSLWINVEAPTLSETDKVSVVLVNKRYTPSTLPEVTEQKTLTLNLSFAGDGRFTAEFPSTIVWGSGYGGTETFQQEFAVVVNGQWLKDPVSGTSNFQTSLYR